jgi:E3 ubiquitin-protein ligase DOA10
MDDIPFKVLIKAFIADMDPFTKKLIIVFMAIVLLMLIYKYVWYLEDVRLADAEYEECKKGSGN